jgi:hypothetical protein
VVVAVLGVLLLVAIPHLQAMRRASAGRAASREFQVLFRSLRYRAISEKRHYGLLFAETQEDGWSWALYRDGDGDGMRTTDIRSGRDEMVDGPWYVGERWSGVELDVPADDPREGPPPSRSDLRDGDPVRFGRTDLVSFSPKGTSSSGTLYIRSAHTFWAVVVYGPSVRVRLWERRNGRWVKR